MKTIRRNKQFITFMIMALYFVASALALGTYLVYQSRFSIWTAGGISAGIIAVMITVLGLHAVWVQNTRQQEGTRMPTARELLDEQNKNKATPATPEADTELQKIRTDTARLLAEAEKNKAEWAVEAQQAGFLSADEYKAGLAQLAKDRETFDNLVQTWDAKNTLTKADYDKKYAQLKVVHDELVARESVVAEREQVCDKRESVLDEAQQATKAKLDELNSDKAVLTRQFVFVRNRLVRLTNYFWSADSAFGDVLAQNVGLLDKQAGKNLANLDGRYQDVLGTLRVMVNDSYDTLTGLMALKRPPDVRNMVSTFDELCQNESWRLIKPERWVNE